MDYPTIKAMHDAGITFLGAVPDPFGQVSFVLGPHEVADFVRDPIDFAARESGGQKADYEEFLEAHGYPRCDAITRKGKLCRNSTGPARRFAEWLASDRAEYCGIHGGGEA